ncbi:MAG TPA: chitobiase/beta-hexosaminidase C-terminal domain-containing protein [Saprospiraceae bacterium]|nr:chitobiase/beta-hexosaminidase C-terminal domain-containing protein [Saprospiraceae bacterium]HMQ82269.1 chitobiase/beta-hexosaminidase C-terminal domain-containing protein [Saprospiraceae bacterium]
METFYFFGRFHPLLLHLPIGFLILALAMELWMRWTKQMELRAALHFTLLLGMASAVLTALFGYWLSLEGGYERSAVLWHQYSGFAAAVLAVATWLLRHKASYRLPALITSFIFIAVAGHLGANLTHGENFLWEHAPAPIARMVGYNSVEKTAANQQIAPTVYHQLVQPILAEKCVSCHNPDKTKGRLMMHTTQALFKGGEQGEAIHPGKPWESLLIQRIILPAQHEEHMPPVGLPQIEAEELALIQWWIENGADTTLLLENATQPPAVKALLLAQKGDPQAQLSKMVRPLKPSTLQKIRAQGINLLPIAQGSPLLEADLSNDSNLNEKKLQWLKKASRQITRLDLSHTPVDDDMLAVLEKLPHLQHLSLHHTALQGPGLRFLKQAAWLQVLNIYATPVSDEALNALYQLPRLKDLYIWQTNISDAGIQQLKEHIPGIRVWTGMEHDTAFQAVQLNAPAIFPPDQEIFQDTMRVELKLNFKGVDIRYTLDGTEPDSNALRYESPILLEATTLLRAKSFKTGWASSELTERQFVRARYRPQTIRLNKKPNPRYAAQGEKSLIDFNKGSNRFSDGLWLGWEKENVEILLDLGEEKEVSSITLGALEDTNAYIFFPKGIKVAGGKKPGALTSIASRDIPTAPEPGLAKTFNFTLHFEPIRARYIRVDVLGNLVNPPWHAAPGAPCWVFLDEVLVE